MTSRLDAALAERGLARSRTHAAALIDGGLVTVNGRPVVKASTKVDEDDVLDVAGADHYVSRGAHKLIAALDAFDITVDGVIALDMGASTGGFTQVLRERGARRVLAVDVGHDQLAASVRADPGVVVVEGFNVRHMDARFLADATGEQQRPGLAVGDLSFISLSLVLPAIAATVAEDADVVLLIKPQFEVGRTAVRGGLVTNPTIRADAVARVLWVAWDQGFGVLGLVPSPILGTHGNAEYLVHLARGRGSNPTEWLSTIDQMAGGR
ncbi:putative 2'-O-ribose RNA methyltransferase [Microbacterium sp. 8M]|uniref:TlyA family RNA methyltransferase n=1 Tax=Microbacterium sp. 8M TaxID=2653153 RepID=UPI0012F1FDA0|nr:TlyA family RNA methyltransferase [Microbacterium sp. 8M]VXC09303.1 putative 2'-O-ribose RNA methyltransferase [Microbacterium sp. 8M]